LTIYLRPFEKKEVFVNSPPLFLLKKKKKEGEGSPNGTLRRYVIFYQKALVKEKECFFRYFQTTI